MDRDDCNLSYDSIIFEKVDVVINSIFKTFLGDKWDPFLKDIAYKTDMKLIKTDGKEIFHGEWSSAEKAHKLLQTGILSLLKSQLEINADGDKPTEVAKTSYDNLLDNTRIENKNIGLGDEYINYSYTNYIDNSDSTIILDSKNKNTYLESTNANHSTLINSKTFTNSNMPSAEMNYNPTMPSSSPFSTDENCQVFFSADHCGMSISVIFGDLLTEHVDGIVCPVPANFSKSMLVTCICQYTGCTELLLTKNLKDPYDVFCYMPTVGNFSYKIIFILLPMATTDYSFNLNSLYNVYDSIFNCSEQMKLRSLALPSVGSGVSEFPVDISANAAWKALENLTIKYKKKYLRLVRFVHIENQVAFYFKIVFESLINSQQNISPHSNPLMLEESTGAISKHSTSIRNVSDISSKISQLDKENKKLENICPICLGEFTDCQILPDCNHKFCKDCLVESFKLRKECPVCRKQYGVITGNQPDGTMNYFVENTNLPGFSNCKTIVIQYYFGQGIQKAEHPNPGCSFTGTTRVAYLPDNSEGQKVLKLLKIAFEQKLTFTIGTSASTGQGDCVIWNGIHHKTNKYGGPTVYGYPDPEYLQRIQQELSEKGIKL